MPSSELLYLKGVGPHRAELLAKNGIRTIEDLLNYLPFRYEDRIHFAKIRELTPGRAYTLQAQVCSGRPRNSPRTPWKTATSPVLAAPT